MKSWKHSERSGEEQCEMMFHRKSRSGLHGAQSKQLAFILIFKAIEFAQEEVSALLGFVGSKLMLGKYLCESSMIASSYTSSCEWQMAKWAQSLHPFEQFLLESLNLELE